MREFTNKREAIKYAKEKSFDKRKSVQVRLFEFSHGARVYLSRSIDDLSVFALPNHIYKNGKVVRSFGPVSFGKIAKALS